MKDYFISKTLIKEGQKGVTPKGMVSLSDIALSINNDSLKDQEASTDLEFKKKYDEDKVELYELKDVNYVLSSASYQNVYNTSSDYSENKLVEQRIGIQESNQVLPDFINQQNTSGLALPNYYADIKYRITTSEKEYIRSNYFNISSGKNFNENLRGYSARNFIKYDPVSTGFLENIGQTGFKLEHFKIFKIKDHRFKFAVSGITERGVTEDNIRIFINFKIQISNSLLDWNDLYLILRKSGKLAFVTVTSSSGSKYSFPAELNTINLYSIGFTMFYNSDLMVNNITQIEFSYEEDILKKPVLDLSEADVYCSDSKFDVEKGKYLFTDQVKSSIINEVVETIQESPNKVITILPTLTEIQRPVPLNDILTLDPHSSSYRYDSVNSVYKSPSPITFYIKNTSKYGLDYEYRPTNGNKILIADATLTGHPQLVEDACQQEYAAVNTQIAVLSLTNLAAVQAFDWTDIGIVIQGFAGDKVNNIPSADYLNSLGVLMVLPVGSNTNAVYGTYNGFHKNLIQTAASGNGTTNVSAYPPHGLEFINQGLVNPDPNNVNAQSYSMAKVAAKFMEIRDTLVVAGKTPSWTEIRLACQRNSSFSGNYTQQNGFGIINKAAVIAELNV